MSYKQYLEARVTHRFNPGWAHLDKWQPVGVFTFLGERQVRPGNGYDEGGVYLHEVIAPRGVDMALAKQAVLSNLSHSRCQHEYDCCGCMFTRARIVHAKGRTLVAEVRVSYNY